MKFRVRRRDGSYSWVWAQSAPQYLDDGTLSGYRCELREFEPETSLPVLEMLAKGKSRRKSQQLFEIGVNLRQSGSVAMLPAKIIAGEPASRVSAEAVLENLNVSVTPMNLLSEKGALLQERAFLHDLLNTATGIQMLMDLFTEASRDERDEHVKLLQASMNLLLSKIDQERTLLDKLCAAPVQIGAAEESDQTKLAGKERRRFKKEQILCS